ncbi:SPFH domain / Band 7 family protein [Candida albicans]|uniref:Prohibitin n=1 Tax=Candida albicans TaxID=5476 RepID=A0A8H6F5P2_CANAX|nr:SPFH domain / Band 7 family protein [Candida albicans]
MSQRIADFVSKIALPAGITIALAQSALYDVPGGKRAVIFDRLKGVKQGVIGEGTHFLVPWLQKAVIFDVRVEPRVITTTTGSKDLQNVSLTLRVLSRPEVRKLPTIYQTLGLDYGERVLPAIGNEILKSIVAQFDAAELITQREVVSARIRQELSRRAAEFNIELEDVSITHMTFGREFTKAVEKKQIAQQDAERSKRCFQALAKAGDGLLMIRRLEASKDIASTLANSPNITYLPNGGAGGGGSGDSDGSKNSLLLNIGR